MNPRDFKLLTPIQTIWVYIFIFLGLFIFALLWYPSRVVVLELYSCLKATFPSEMDDPGVYFIKSIWVYGAIIGLVAVAIYGWTQAHKKRSYYVR